MLTQRFLGVFCFCVLIGLPGSSQAFNRFKGVYSDVQVQRIKVRKKNVACVLHEGKLEAAIVRSRGANAVVRSFRFIKKRKLKNYKKKLASGAISQALFDQKKKKLKRKFRKKFTKLCQQQATELFDGDGDGLGNARDNCPANFNPGQQDSDRNGTGNICDRALVDRNDDGRLDAIDTNNDGIADAFDEDFDGIFDEFDTDFNGETDALDTNYDGIADFSNADFMSEYSSNDPADLRYLAKSAGYGISSGEAYILEIVKSQGLQAGITEYIRDRGYLEPAVLEAYDKLDYASGGVKATVHINGPPSHKYYNIHQNGSDYLYRDKEHNTNLPCLKDDRNLRLTNGSRADPEGGNLYPLPIAKLDRGLRYGHVKGPLIHLHAHTTNPYLERMTKFLMSVWTVGVRNADNWSKYSSFIRHYDHLRILARNGDLTKLAIEMTKSPQMIEYLDGHFNQKGQINENYSREFLELFVTGTVHPLTGEENFNSADITPENPTNDLQELARVFTGNRAWPNRTTAPDGTALCVRTYGLSQSDKSTDLDAKTLFKDVSAPTIQVASGERMESVIAKIITSHPSVPYYYAQEILQHYVEAKPSKMVVRAFGDEIKRQNMNIRLAMETLFRSNYFYRRSLHENTVSMDIFDWFIGVARRTGVVPDLSISRFYDRSRMNLITPDSVFWYSPDTWHSAASNFAKDNVSSDLYEEAYSKNQSNTEINKQISASQDPLADLRYLCPAGSNAASLVDYASDLHGVSLSTDQKLTLQFQLNQEITNKGDLTIAFNTEPARHTSTRNNSDFYNSVRQKMRKCLELHHIISSKHPQALVR